MLPVPLPTPPSGFNGTLPAEPNGVSFFALGFSVYLQLAIWHLPVSWREFLAKRLLESSRRREGKRRRPGIN